MLKKILIAGIAITLLVSVIVLVKLGQFGAMEEAASKMVFPPETVTATTASDAQWEQFIPATASVSAVQGVLASAEAGGRVTKIMFDSGDSVIEGQVLVQLDISSEKAQLASNKASASQARAELKRVRSLIAKNLISEDAVDRAITHVKETEAQVEVVKASLDKKTIRAPFAGRLGIRQINQGQILSIGDPIVALQMLSRVYVDFSVPQQRMLQIARDMKVRVKSDATPGEVFNGNITAVNLEVDPVTRNVQVRARVENPEEKLRTGMFVNVELILPDTQKVLPIPATAVLYAPFGNSVFIIDEKKNEETGETQKVLRQQFVILGRARGDYVDVTDGLKNGETVVTSGVFKLRSGSQVVIDNTLAPKASLEPNPKDS